MRALSLILVSLLPVATFAAISPDATCGGVAGYTCVGSNWGNCCSQYGWCGRTTAYCNVSKGCQSAFGTCSGLASSVAPSSSTRATSSTGFRTSTVSRTSAAAVPSSTQLVSTNARCGPSYGGRTCLGSAWGSCCSQYSYCGSTIGYCAAETCQKGFGLCSGLISSSSATVSPTAATSSLASSSVVIQSSSSSTAPLVLAASSSSTAISSTATSTIPPSPSTLSSSAMLEQALSSTSSTVSVFSSTPSPSRSSSSSVIVPSSTVTNSLGTPSATPTPQPSCGIRGIAKMISDVSSTIVMDSSLESCKIACETYNTSGATCRIFGFYPPDNRCSIISGAIDFTFSQIVIPNSAGAVYFYDAKCSLTPVGASSSPSLAASASSSAVSSTPSPVSTLSPSPTLSPSVLSSPSPFPSSFPSPSSSSLSPSPSPSPSGTPSSSLTPSPSPTPSPTPSPSPSSSPSPSPVISSATSSAPTSQASCALVGVPILSATFTNLKSLSQAQCKEACRTWTSGGSCGLYSMLLPLFDVCTIYYGNPAPTWGQIFYPYSSGSSKFYDMSC